MFRTIRRPNGRAKHCQIAAQAQGTSSRRIAWLSAALLLVMTVMAGGLTGNTALANGSGTKFTVKLTNITYFTSTVREGSFVPLTLTGTFSPSGNTLSDADREAIVRAVRDALTLSGTGTLEDISYLRTEATIDSAAGTFSISADVFAIDDGLVEGTETLRLSYGNLPVAEFEITDLPQVNIAVQEVSYSEAYVEEGGTSTLIVKLSHDQGILKDGDNLLFVLDALARVRNKVAFSGSASKSDRTITIPARPGILGGYDPQGGTNYQLPVGQAVFYLEVSALEDDKVERPETVIASHSGKSATLVIFDKETAIAPYLQVRADDPGVTGQPGARQAHFTVTNYGANADNAFDFDVRITGPALRPEGSDSGDLVRTLRFPAGSSGGSVALVVTIDETRISSSNQTLNVSIAAPQSGQPYQVGTPNRATVNINSDAPVKGRTQQVIARHMNRVAALITGDTGRARLRDRQRARSSSSGGGQAFHLGGNVRDQQERLTGNVAFATSTDRLRAAALADTEWRLSTSGVDAVKYGLGRTNAGSRRPAWDVWVTGKYSYERTGKGADRSTGHTGLVRAGVDYLLDTKTLVGIMAQYDTSKDKSSRQKYEVSGHGWMIGPYLEMQLSENIYFDAKVLGGRSDNDVSPFATYTDSFDTRRWLASARLTGYWTFGAWQFTPSAELVTYQDRQAAYTDSNGLAIGGQTLRVNRLIIGPEISHRFTTADGATISPRLAVRGLWRFGGKRTKVDTSVPNSIAVDPIELDGVQGRVEAGLKIQMPSGLSVDLEGSYDGIGRSDRSGASVSGRVSIPLQ